MAGTLIGRSKIRDDNESIHAFRSMLKTVQESTSQLLSKKSEDHFKGNSEQHKNLLVLDKAIFSGP